MHFEKAYVFLIFLKMQIKNGMKFKVKLFDKKLMTNYFTVLTVISLFCSFAFLVIEIPKCLNLSIGICLVILLLGIYFLMWIKANLKTKTTLKINNSTIVIKTGNIFEENNLKVIAFNEYFDTIVDNHIIAESSLNGIYIKSKVNDVGLLDNLIDSNDRLNQKVLKHDYSRLIGKKKLYELGTIFQNDDFILTAFSKFDKDNRAYLSMNEYINFLLNFWNEIDIIYAGRSLSIPLLGSGITRFKEYNSISEQELLELLIWSFKNSRIKFTYPSVVKIIIHESKKDKINFYKLNSD